MKLQTSLAITVLISLLVCCPLARSAEVQPYEHLAAKILQTTGFTGGLIVHVGCGDGRVTAALAAGAGSIVQGLDTDAGNVDKARQYIRSRGLYGRVVADTFDDGRLPYTDNLVNLLVVSKKGRLSQEEMLRALAPGGVAYVRDGDAWRVTVKPWPDDIDQWTHYLHGPDNNAVAQDTVVGPPRHMQWLGTPLWTRNHHKLNSVSAVVTAKGRLFYIMDEAPAANITLPGEWFVVARDAFSGVELWRKPMKSWAWHEIRFRSGPPEVTRLLVASGDRVYAPLGLNAPVSVMDAASGKTLKTYEDTGGAEELVLFDDVLLVLKGSPVAAQAIKHPAFADMFQSPNHKTIVAIQTETGKTLWKWSDPKLNPKPETLACDGKKVYVQVGEGVLCLDLKSGKPLWTAGEPVPGKSNMKALKIPGFGTNVLVVSDGVVLCTLSGRLTAMSAENGKRLWDCDAGGGFHAPTDVFVIDGLVWHGSHVKDSVAPPAEHDFNEGRDLHTGQVKKTNSIMADLQTAGHHHRCYREKATCRYILAGKRGIELMDLDGDNNSRNNWVRGTCQYGILPANGLIYAPPHSCGCYMESLLKGFWALASEQTEFQKTPDGRRLDEGPAYGKRIEAESETEAWPQYRCNALRSGIAKTTVPEKLRSVWTTSVGGRLTPPVVARGRVVLASIDEGTVYAIDQQSGKVAWRYVTGGRIDSPPAIYEGKVLCGSADGYVYCLRLSDGELIWRFLAAREDVRTVAEDQVESLWRVHGSVLVLNGIVYCSAGRSTWLDGGIDLYGLDPSTGKIVYRTRYESQPPKLGKGKDEDKPEYNKRISQNVTDYKTFEESDLSDSFSMAGGSVSDVLVSDGRDVFMHQACFDAKLNKQDNLKRHLLSTSSLLDDAENHRSHWVLGTGDFSRLPVAYSWVVNHPMGRTPTIAVPTGVMMVFEDDALWGVRRDGDSNGKYTIFKKDNKPFSETEKSLPDFRRIPKNQIDLCVWKHDLPVRTRAMLKSGGRLFMGVIPIETPQDAARAGYSSSDGAAIWVVAADDGVRAAEYKIPSEPVWDGMAAADGRLFVSMVDGSVTCWRGGSAKASK